MPQNTPQNLPGIEDCDLLIVRGAAHADDLVPLGLSFAQRFQRAKTVVLIPDQAPAWVLKGDPARVMFVDADARMQRLMSILERIKEEYEAKRPRDVGRVPEKIGMFLFYWVGFPEAQTVCDLLSAGDLDAVNRAAESFIKTDFGADVSRLASLSSDGDEHPGRAAAGRPSGSFENATSALG
jgi:hypothetical protein